MPIGTRVAAIDRHHPSLLTLLLSVVAALFSVGSIHLAAQPRVDSTRRPTTTSRVVVEALRIPVGVDSTSYAASIVDIRSNLLGRGKLALDEALAGVPGLQIDNRHNGALGERIVMRGFGARSGFGVRGIRLVYDGVPATFADGQSALDDVDPDALGRAEVIRGPAAALYGNASGGVISLLSPAAPAGPFEERVSLVGTPGRSWSVGSTTAGHIEGLDYRLRLSTASNDGFREQSASQKTNLRGGLALPLAGGELRLDGGYLHFDAENPGSLTDSAVRADPTATAEVYRRQKTGKVGNQGALGLSWMHPLSPKTSLQVAAHGIVRSIDNPITSAVIRLRRTAYGGRGLVSGAVDFVGEPLRWNIGLDVQRQEDDRRNFVNNSGTAGDVTLDQQEGVTALGLFAAMAVPLTPSFRISLAGRYDRTLFAVADRLVTTDDPDDSGDRTMEELSPAIGAVWNIDRSLSIYTNIATAFETPTTTELANRPDGAGGFNPLLRPQRTVSWEMGGRGSGAAYSWSLAGYYALVDDALIPFGVPGVDGRDFFRNAGSALHQGIEAALDLNPVNGLVVHASYSFVDARFRRYVVEGVAFDGNAIPGVAPHLGRLAVTYRFEVGLVAGVEGGYRSRTSVDDANTTYSDGYALAGLRLAFDDESPLRIGRIVVSPFAGVENLFDSDYNASVTVNAFGRRYFEPGPGRTIHVGVNFLFSVPE